MPETSQVLPGIPLIESPLFKRLINSLPPYEQSIAQKLNEDGYAIIDFPEPDLDAIVDKIIRDLNDKYNWDGWRSQKRANPSQNAGGLRLQDGLSASKDILRLACNQKVIDLLSTLYGRRAFPFQTLNFPVGSEQHFHTDALHFSSVPEKFMCGVWLAFEDIGPDQGPLVYYPGSHKLPCYDNSQYGVYTDNPESRGQSLYERAWAELVEDLGLKRELFFPKKGQALIWLANLLHGGTNHLDPNKTRWSQVTHYYFEDCAYITPVHSDPIVGRIQFKNIVNLSTGKRVEHSYMGRSIPQDIIAQFQRGGPLPLDFDPVQYLALNDDVRIAGVDPREHYLSFGRREGRLYKKETI